METEFTPYGLHSIHIPLGLLTYPRVGWGAKALYGRLALHRGRRPNGECIAGIDRLAVEMATPTRTIESWLRELVAHKFIRREKRGLNRSARCIFLPHPCLIDPQLSAGYAPQQIADQEGLDPQKTAAQNASDPQKLAGDEPQKTAGANKEENIQLKNIQINAQNRQINTASLDLHPRKVTPTLFTRDQATWFAEWWSQFWRRERRTDAERVFASLVTTSDTFNVILDATKQQTEEMLNRETRYRPLPATWLNSERWRDEPSPRMLAQRRPRHRNGLEELIEEYERAAKQR